MPFSFSPGSLSDALNKKTNPGTPLPPPKVSSSGAGNPGFISKPVSIETQNMKPSTVLTNTSAPFRLGTNLPKPASPHTFGENEQKTADLAPRTFMPTESKPTQGLAGTASGDSSGGSSTGMTQTPTQPVQNVPAGNIPGQTPGQPGYYLNQLQNLQNQYAPVIGSSAAQPGTSTGFGTDLANFNSAALTAKEAAPISGLQATMPQAFGYSSNVINPVTGQSFGAGAAGQGGAFYGGQVAATNQQGGQYQTGIGAQKQAQALSSNLVNLIQSKNINPTGLTYANGVIQAVANKLGDPDYQNASNLINEIAAKYATILTPAGGSTTDYQSHIAHGLINELAQGKSIIQVLQEMDKNAGDSLGQLKAAGSGGPSGSGGNSLYDF